MIRLPISQIGQSGRTFGVWQAELLAGNLSVTKMQTPSSPASASPFPVLLRDCIEESLRYVLSSFVEDKLGTTELGLSKQYCSQLLRDEGDNHLDSKDAADTSGVAFYPLYKRVASTLSGCIVSGNSLRASHKIESTQETELIEQQENEWNRLISDKGLALALKAVEFELHVQEPFFTQLREGLKTVEGRCAVGNYNRIAQGDLLLLNKCLLLEVQCVGHYSSFSELLKTEGLAKVLPGIETVDEGIQVYRNFYTEEKEKTNGVRGISVSRLADQPYMHVSSILAGLGYSGMASTVGLVQTAGTVLNALPPSRSALLSSFIVPYQQNVKGSTLTNGARALSKHVSRSSNCWWGGFFGNDHDKNQIALKVTSHLITNCCWMNVHITQPHGPVFEVRVGEGYGARWSQDGSKFIGFLEPYTQDGYCKGWKN
ncbi:hypothetical protein H6P81_015999 [Aristolochia fimbriata]|uniref:ASCH domain-containing protein n=1 Tax=Aristolochia fimbriata TaxID=158543 RepID=A0AAV7E7Q8_ARIFI|nr:hypothetical protein H6P81_015999 [Aristolochia fimbriata]